MANNPKILVVDDEPHVRAFVSMLLKSTFNAVEVLQAGDEPGALAICTSSRPELVLLDINLVGVSGLDLLPRILKAQPEAVVIMLTAVSVRHAVEEARAKGASGYILKDTTPEEMSAAIIEVVRDKFGLADPAASR